MVLNNSFHSREADPHVIKNPPSGNGCCETAEHFTYTGYLSSRSVKAVTSMATFSLVHNILHTTPTHHHHLRSSQYWAGKLPGVLSLFRAHIVLLLLLLLVAVVARRRETLPGPDDFRWKLFKVFYIPTQLTIYLAHKGGMHDTDTNIYFCRVDMVTIVLWDISTQTFLVALALGSQILSFAVLGELLLRIAAVCTVAAAAAY